jgi:hypothetical protein
MLLCLGCGSTLPWDADNWGIEYCEVCAGYDRVPDMESSKVDELESRWRRAYLAFEKNDSLANHVREKEAWLNLSQEKKAWGMCLAPGCRKIDPPYSYCTNHREHDEHE